MNVVANSWHAQLHRLQQAGLPHALATQVTGAGSTPREPGARMVITATETFDTLGGGHFEWQVIEAARQRLGDNQAGISLETFALGGRSGQCCGGFVNVLIEVFSGAATRLAVFGAGNVGRELVRLASPLNWRIQWFDERDELFPGWEREQPRLSRHDLADPEAAVASLNPGSHALVMTHDHGLDRALVDALLRRGDCASIGLIGSQSKWASFRSRLRATGHGEQALAQVRCPIGAAPDGRKPSDKTPYAIALVSLAELVHLVADGADNQAGNDTYRGLAPQRLRAVFPPTHS
ncbi:xanthine dehydrogenase accessory protein XdhC [Pistricoccus aurantiacus]|uniref:Xanthine dehydrogenase accessory protein XdhC n=1 Tax=Pistricoccus aurantiacus TaxID=1883414 RepID=A0A5B8SR24_9GAMM|nr:xanthine dehydrogenase accessory protein XdhC [Pistricoccus aurantiacus]QEA39619.1 xanthine dehydrogenase accessory protein XdhC [Pistricoccus aurantiacus]